MINDFTRNMIQRNNNWDKGEGYQQEFLLDGASAQSIWNQISTARGLSEWFAPRVEMQGLTLHIFWDEKGDNREANIIEIEDKCYILWRWNDDPESYLRMEIVVTELSQTISLLVDDHDLSLDQETLAHLWDNHLHHLKTSLGIIH